MSLINQDVRFADRGDANNPTAIYSQYKPVRFLSGSGVPSPALGEDCHHYIDDASSIEYVKRNGVWEPLVNYATIVAPSLPPASVPDNLTADTLDNKNTGDLAINATAALSLSGGSLDIDATGDILIDSVTDLIVTSATGKVELQGSYLSLQGTGTIPTQITSYAGGVIVQGKFGHYLDLNNQDLTLAAGFGGKLLLDPAVSTEFSGKPVNGISSINGSDSITEYKNLGVNSSSQLVYQEPCDSIQGVVPNIKTTAGSQYWEVGVSTAPADFFSISLPSSAATNRKLIGLSAHFLHNNATWQIASGSVNIEVAYVPQGQAPTVANKVVMYTTPSFQNGVIYPILNLPAINAPVTMPVNASIVVSVVKGPGVTLTANQSDVSLCLKFL